MTGKPQRALLEFKVSFSFFIIGLQAGEEVMLGGFNLLSRSVLYYTKHSVRICRNGVNRGGGVSSSRSIKKKKKKVYKVCPPINKRCTHKNKAAAKDEMTRSEIYFS